MAGAAAASASEIFTFESRTGYSSFADFAFLPLVFCLALSVATALFCMASFSTGNVFCAHLPEISYCAQILSTEGPWEGTGL